MSDMVSRRRFLAGLSAAGLGTAAAIAGRGAAADRPPALIGVTLDLEMSRHYPKRGMLEWDYQKGNLDQPTKDYTVEFARVLKQNGGLLHAFLVGRVLEQADVSWVQQLAEDGHAIGNHTYDHVNVLATTPEQVQFRFKRSPWLVDGKKPAEIIRSNIEVTTRAMKQRTGISPNGFRTPGGFSAGLSERPDVRRILTNQGFDWISAKYPPFKTSAPEVEPDETVFQNIVRAQSAAQPFRYEDGMVEIPMSPISDVHAFRTLRWSLDSYLEAIRRAVTWAIENGGVFDYLAHPSCLVVEDPELKTVRLICRLVQEAGDAARLVTLDKIAELARTA